MTDQTPEQLADRFETIRRALAVVAADRPTPEQTAEWDAADKAMAQRIRAALPGVPLHHAYAVLQALRVTQRLDASAGVAPATDQTEPVCKFAEGCHRVVPCDPGCGAADPTERRTRYAAAMAVRDGDTWPTEYENDEADYLRRAEAVMAVADAEQAELRTRAGQVEELLAVAHETSNRSEAERARAVQRAERAERAETAIERVRAAIRIADDEDVTDWQRGFRACHVVATQALADQPPAAVPADDQTEETDEQRADRLETERDHAAGDHQYCGVTCEAEFPSDMLRNGILAKGYPGTAGMLDELLRRVATAAVLPDTSRAAVLREAADAVAADNHGILYGTATDYADRHAALLRRMADGEQQTEEAKPEPTAPPVCEGFVWIGQSLATCDRCGQPAWDHTGEEVPVEGAAPFDNRRTVRPWEPGQADRIRAKWEPQS
ncbi:MAG: hypothetical protein HOV68_31685 [Streptomycetaceae bacterium]|nr:hypothetical protein [Streptomycetaceae bacterium]